MATSESDFDRGRSRDDRIHQIANDCFVRRAAGEEISDESIITAHPELMPELTQWLRGLGLLHAARQRAKESREADDEWRGSGADSSSTTHHPSRDTHHPLPIPARIGRYRIEKMLGKGGFGRVFLAHDEQLGRPVAVKVPHARIVSSADRAEAYLAEARMVANLDHPNIVPIHDVGSTDEYPCFMICKYVDGSNLSTRMKQSRLNYREAAQLVATVAEALHYAHKQGCVHRDVKPGNILIGNDGKPYVVDFGLALGERSFGKGPRYAGTPAYMSPEQALGEGHRVDGRSDVFSLGVVLYELLVGRRPFRGNSQSELFELITRHEPRPVRHYDDRIPKELERICHKTLAKRTRDRYLTAKDFAEDLQHFVDDLSASEGPTAANTAASIASDSTAASGDSTSKSAATSGTPTAFRTGSSLSSHPLKIVPKGLRSFDAHDADFFLELLPGPRDRHGLPDSIRFWKTRIEETDPDSTFSVGLIYGPSGCGKSSLVKAGLLPRLSGDVIPIYLEATAQDTEEQLLHRLRRRCATLDDNLDLQKSLAAVRLREAVPVGKQVLIILDQFEQWLHPNGNDPNTELVRALRQCDCSRLKCIVMVRDEFWLAATRFMGALEIDLRQGRNMAMADLFDEDHASQVLAAFGRAFGQLPEQASMISKPQKAFLRQAVAGLAEDGKVPCVRLALFAEMMKGRRWAPASLKDVGGTRGIGATFLDKAFSARAAHPKHRLHQHAARNVLKELLPESGSDIRGQRKAQGDLLEASGYARRPRDFDDLIRLLDTELRLITPAEVMASDDPVLRDGWCVAGKEEVASPITHHAPPTTRHYQLTHDCLVPSLRDWLTRKQQESRRGRAELCLAQTEALWSRKPENRHLPSLWECFRITALTAAMDWSEPRRKMMRKATRVHCLRWGSALLVVVAIMAGIARSLSKEANERSLDRTRELVRAVADSSGVVLPLAIDHLELLPKDMVIAELRSSYDSGPNNLSLACALAKYRIEVGDGLVAQIETASPEEVDNLVTALKISRAMSLQNLHTAAAVAERQNKWPLKARLAVVALHLGEVRLASDMCQIANRPDPIQRSTFIKRCATWHGDLGGLVDALPETIDDPSLRSGLCLAVGSIPLDGIPPAVKEAWTIRFKKWFECQSDSGTHSAAAWALGTWRQKLPVVATSTEPTPERDWFVNGLGMTMLRIPCGTVHYKQDDGTPCEVEVSRPFWLQDREVSLGLFERFANDPDHAMDERPIDWEPDKRYGLRPTAGLPVSNALWNNAVLFCNWLSRKEELDPCYERAGQTASFPSRQLEFEVWRLDKDANGYRLPTESEWEFACRADTATWFTCGNDAELLRDYAVFRSGRILRCGSKLPNAWGLFDMHGNVCEWCHPPEDRADVPPEERLGRLRGGACLWRAAGTASADSMSFERFLKSYITGNDVIDHYGFRVARNDSQ